MRTIGVLLFLTTLLSLHSDAAQDSSIKPVATVLQLHQAMINPASDALFNAPQKPPQNDDQWLAVQNNAIILMESANLLMLEGRAKDNAQWMKLSRRMLDAGELALRAVQQKNLDALMDADDQIVSSCEACHQPYRDQGHKMGPRK